MKRIDARAYQIAALAGLLLYGVFVLRFEVTLWRAAAIVAAAIATQALCARLWRMRFDPRSAAISGLSLALLLRANDLWLLLVAAAVAVASKFVIRINGKHLFNPTNFAIVVLLLTDRVWVSPGQWGNIAFFGFLMTCIGGIVVNRAERSDVTFAFIVAWCAILFGRSLWLGEPMAIPIHRLESGALLLFTFFMISDPRTTPDSRAGRIIFATLVALGAGYIQFRLFRTNGILWSLALTSLVTPILDALLPARRFTWEAIHRDPSPRGTGESVPQAGEGQLPHPAFDHPSTRFARSGQALLPREAGAKGLN